MGPTSMHESALSKTIGTLGSGSGSGTGSVSGSGEPIPRGPMDKFTTSQPRQSTLNSKWKQEERKEMLLQTLGPGFKPPSMHELRTWILKEEVNDLSIIMEDHKKLRNNMDVQLCQMVGQMEKVGDVVQVITDNASNYVNAGMRLMEKRSRLWWTPCAAHCIDLMLEDIGKLNVHATTLSRARQVVNNYTVCYLHFLLSKVFIKQKQALIAMFSSEKWCSSTWAKKTTVPLVSVLREVDSEERLAMGYIYELMDSAKEKIAFNCRGMERKYGPIWRKIDARWTPQLHRPLHAAGYYLNPQLRYGDKFSNVDEVRKGLFECMDRMLDYQERLKADIQLDSYDQAMGEFGSRIAIDSRTLRSPTSWWMRFGGSHRSCKSLLFESLALLVVLRDVKEIGAHLNRYNTRLRERSLQRKQNVDPILVEEIDSDDERIAEKEDPLLPLDLCWFQDNELFNVDAIRVVSSNSQETQASLDHMVSSHSYKRKHNEVPSTSGGKGKEKELNLTPIDEDEDLDEMGIHDSGHFPTIDTLDEDDDDLGEEDLS
ncbi:hypothetical protein CK203_065365 [Vitis vinifera]|uniref:DUF659 domain-containing protein n=1 Tax=Vitis vinifera TaxID=29760 RepID=A0A438G7J5_VITVI|nr:hypothetical protein CK203_065365 [Vitis vinifera]